MKVFYSHLFAAILILGNTFAQTDTLVNRKSDFYKNEVGIEVGYNRGSLEDQYFTYWEYAKLGGDWFKLESPKSKWKKYF